MIRNYVAKLNIKPSQRAALQKILQLCSDYYNHCCALRSQSYADKQPFVSYNELAKQAINWKNILDPEGVMYSQIVQDICKRNTLAYEQFFKRIKEKSKQAAGLPKVKSKPSKSFKLIQSGFSLIGINNNLISKVKLWKSSQVGSVKLTRKLSLPSGAKVKNLSIICKANDYFVVITCEVPATLRVVGTSAKILTPYDNTITNASTKKHSVGVDLGIRDFIATSDGVFLNCEAIKKNEKTLDKLNKVRKNKEKQHKKSNFVSQNSRKYRRLMNKIAKQHLKIQRVRADFQHKVANYLLSNYDNIQVEDLNIIDMIDERKYGKNFRRRIHGAAWGQFVNILNYKAQLYNSNVNKVNPAYTSQLCICGANAKKELSETTHICNSCGVANNRDVMAAKVIDILGNDQSRFHKHLSEARDALISKRQVALK